MSVTAVVTHYNRPHLIGEAIQSLLNQSRLPDEIIVIDDASERAPFPFIPDHPLISVYRSTANVGPYRLIEWAIGRTSSDWYMIQDCDDISMPTRLERLLGAAEAHGADMVGSAMHRLVVATGEARVISFPEDAVAEHLSGDPLFLCAWPSSIISRTLWSRVGGIATGLRFSGDAELTSRACCAGKVVNVQTIELFRRVFPDSLTRRADTGMQSPARKALREQLRAQANARIASLRAGLPVDLRPFSTAPQIDMALVRRGAGVLGDHA